jgi:hypothetical protein
MSEEEIEEEIESQPKSKRMQSPEERRKSKSAMLSAISLVDATHCQFLYTPKIARLEQSLKETPSSMREANKICYFCGKPASFVIGTMPKGPIPARRILTCGGHSKLRYCSSHNTITPHAPCSLSFKAESDCSCFEITTILPRKEINPQRCRYKLEVSQNPTTLEKECHYCKKKATMIISIPPNRKTNNSAMFVCDDHKIGRICTNPSTVGPSATCNLLENEEDCLFFIES